MDLSGFTPNQRKAVQHLDGPLLICAGAGTGKTFTLTQRIAWALVGDPDKGIEPFLESIDQALVITFTKKAAAELKSRFRSTLRSVGRFDDALKVDDAWVSTIHGMCSRILREHALELGIDPEFKMAEGAFAQEALTQAIDEAIRDADGYQKFQPLFDEYETHGVKSMLELVINKASCQTRGIDAFCLGPGPADTAALLRLAIELAEGIAATGKGKTAQRASIAAESLSEFQQAGANTQDLPDLVKSLELRYMRGEGVADLKQALEVLQDANNLNGTWNLLQLLIELARKVEAHYQAILASQSKLDTSDLIRRTLAAFDAFPEIARQYTDRFKLIMVDEFQDTSQLQIDMIERIAGPGKPHLCTVGDSQQSIYRFQGADVDVYLRHKREMRDAGALTVELQDNFRSNADILAFVRTVCGKPGFFVEGFLDLHAGSTGRCYHGSAPRVELAVTLFDRGCTEAAVAEEARLIASRFRTLIDEGHRPSDMVILMGATTRMETYASALREQGIPCMASGGSKYYSAPHVRRCLSLLRVLANPYDSSSMMDVLSSEVLPVSSGDLLRLSTYLNQETNLPTRQNFAMALLRADREPQEASPLLHHAARVLRQAWGKLGFVRPSKLFMETIIDSGWLDRLYTQGEQGHAVLADLMKFVRLVETAEQEAGFDIAQVAAAMAAASAYEKEPSGVLSVEGLQAVRLMTAHGSKGLEFPIVAVTSCFTSRTDGGALRTEVENGTVYASLMPKKETLKSSVEAGDNLDLAHAASLVDLRARIVELDAQRAQAERRRLFYVATTRATDALIVAMNKQRAKEMKYREVEADLLNALFPGEADFPATSGTFDYGGSEPGVFTRIDVYADDEESDETASDEAIGVTAGQAVLLPELAEPFAPELSPFSRRVGFFSYSSIATHDAPSRPFDEGAAEGNDEELAAQTPIDADKATDFGSALHRTCEWLALQENAVADEVATETARRFAKTYGVTGIDRLLDAVNHWRRSTIAARSYAFASCQPEVPFCIQVADGFLEGEIDLLCTNGDGHAFIVDYKTGGSDTETDEWLHEKHLLQAQCYAYAALSSGYKSVELHFVRVERSDQREPGQPQVVDYTFDVNDREELARAIATARASHL